MRRPILAAVALAAGTAAVAQMPKWTPPSSAPSAVRAGTYKVETHHTQVLFSVMHMGFNSYYGKFPGATGTLTLDPAKPANSSFDISIPVNQVTTANAKLDEELRSPQFFDPAKFPTINFKSTKVVPTGATTADVTGNLTLHGVTRPLTLKVKFNAAGVAPMINTYQAGFEATGTLKRSDFGVGYGIPLVGDEVKIIVTSAFEQK